MTPPIVKRYLIALDRHKWAGLAGFAVVLGLSGVAALQPEPPASYRSEGLLTYVSPPIILSQTATALQEQGRSMTPEMLMPPEVVQYTIETLLEQGFEVSEAQIRRAARVRINPDDNVPGFNVQVTYQDSDPERSQLVVQVLMQAIEARSEQFNTVQLNKIISNLEDLLPRVENELRVAEQDLEQYIRLEGPAIQASQDGALVGAIAGAQQEQRQIRITLAEYDAQIASLQRRLGLNVDQAYASSALSADPIIADLRAQIYQAERETILLSPTLRPEHPRMVELRSQQQALETLLQQRVNEVIGGGGLAQPLGAGQSIRSASSLDPARQQLADTLVTLQIQRETMEQRFAALVAAEQELREEYSNIPNKQLELARLQQQVDLKRQFYDQLQARLADVTIAENETVGSLVIASAATTDLAEATDRNPLVILLVGGFVGVLVGGGLVFLLDSLDATFRTLPDLQNALRQQEVPVLGLLPLMPADDPESNRLVLITEPDSPYIDSYERLRSALRRLTTDNPIKMVVVTSTLSQEGKTLTAYNLAIASARAGRRTLLIEADLRSPSHCESLGMTPDPTYLKEPLHYYGHLHDTILRVPGIENLFILPSPGAQRQAAAVLESSEMRHLLEDARGRFDMVILDTPALSRYSDALLLDPLTDGLLLVTRPGYTEEGILNEAIEQFMESEEIQFLGAVINGADIPSPTKPALEEPSKPPLLQGKAEDDSAEEPDAESAKIEVRQ
jgi:capsular exopolysaccharide synthesis family protein